MDNYKRGGKEYERKGWEMKMRKKWFSQRE
jgi:hypothetical protein